MKKEKKWFIIGILFMVTYLTAILVFGANPWSVTTGGLSGVTLILIMELVYLIGKTKISKID